MRISENMMRLVRTFLPGLLVGIYDLAIVSLYKYVAMPNYPDGVPLWLQITMVVIAIGGSFIILNEVHFVKKPPEDKDGNEREHN